MPSTLRGAEGVLGPQLVVHGRLHGKCAFHVEGVVEGEIHLEGPLAVGPDGTIVGPVRARSVDVSGELHGDVMAESVMLRAGGLLQGDVRASRVSIDDGAALHGAIDMDFTLGESAERTGAGVHTSVGVDDDEDATDIFSSEVRDAATRGREPREGR